MKNIKSKADFDTGKVVADYDKKYEEYYEKFIEDNASRYDDAPEEDGDRGDQLHDDACDYAEGMMQSKHKALADKMKKIIDGKK